MADYYCVKCGGRTGMYGHWGRWCRIALTFIDDGHYCCPNHEVPGGE
jgi:hypothetical protein